MKKLKFNEEKTQVLKDLKQMKTKKQFIKLLSLYLKAQGYITIQINNSIKNTEGKVTKIKGKII
jgi:mannitol/fructose-specific phosphotransferase system IIA component (Ntr-type)